MKAWIALVRREFWEHRGSFLWVPMTVGALLFFVALCAALAFTFGFRIAHLSAQIHVNQPTGLAPLIFYMLGIPFVVILWVIMGSYFLGTLFDDRKDKSILLWQSLPISQFASISSKLFTGLVLAPLLLMLCLLGTQIAFLLLGSFFCIVNHVPYWLIFWRPMPMIWTWWGQLLGLAQQSLWCFSIAGWFLLCSAFSRKSPLIRAVLPIVILLAIEGFFLPQPYLWHFLQNTFIHVLNVWSGVMDLIGQTLEGRNDLGELAVAKSWYDKTLMIGIFMGLVFVFIAAWLRRRCYDQ